jgi:flagellar basal body rod protein FlgG
MIKGYYSAVTGMLVNSNREQVIAQNIANMQTPGFKQVLSRVEDWASTGIEFSPGNLLRDRNVKYVGQLGLGAMSGPETVDFSQGSLQTTGNPTDMAIEGDGFFRVKTADGVRYTRDGRFLRDAQNNLVTTEGFNVLDSNNQAIKLPDGELGVSPEGVLTVNGAAAGTLGLSIFKDPKTELVRDRGNLFTGPAQSTGTGQPKVTQSTLEMSNANPTRLMTEMVEVARSYEAAQKMVQNQDELLGKTIASLGRIG